MMKSYVFVLRPFGHQDRTLLTEEDDGHATADGEHSVQAARPQLKRTADRARRIRRRLLSTRRRPRQTTSDDVDLRQSEARSSR